MSPRNTRPEEDVVCGMTTCNDRGIVQLAEAAESLNLGAVSLRNCLAVTVSQTIVFRLTI
jgi:hypothetical protein